MAHAAKAQGISRQCAHRWINRFREHGKEALVDRSSRPHHSPRQTPVEVEERIVAIRREQRRDSTCDLHGGEHLNHRGRRRHSPSSPLSARGACPKRWGPSRRTPWTRTEGVPGRRP
ncbi:leucine zipper domain-containing protein [Janibacter melonis]|uniref:leucine zipper domain-containing protein n=1 Tax=Janibacter melonis TaxID=262209 RepID=UPI0035567351